MVAALPDILQLNDVSNPLPAPNTVLLEDNDLIDVRDANQGGQTKSSCPPAAWTERCVAVPASTTPCCYELRRDRPQDGNAFARPIVKFVLKVHRAEDRPHDLAAHRPREETSMLPPTLPRACRAHASKLISSATAAQQKGQRGCPTS